ncbi:MAG: hypothetical protein IJX81_07535 [Clostridia bacterium]|nr:hypothetical protein [Clostridia bacterium]
MNNFFKDYKIEIGEILETAFHKDNNNFQDGTTPMYRDVDGKLWAMSGHSHMGAINMFCGTSLDDMKKVYEINTNFCVGHADYAFSGIRYPEGNKPVGSIWPFGLYICPNTHRFFCFFHNETGWNGKGTGYDAYGLCKAPKIDSDFRHIGLMHSDDEGRNWTFDRWVLTGEEVDFTENYNPGTGNAIGQKAGDICLGSGDFSLFVEPDGEYMYIFYNKIYQNSIQALWTGCDVFVARTRKRTDGVMGDFVKYYNGAFCEPGNLGKETAIALCSWHPRVLHSAKHGLYFLSSSHVNVPADKGVIDDVMEVRTSTDLIHWSDPIRIEHEGKEFGNHYVAMVAEDDKNQPCTISGDEFSILSNHNGTNVTRYRAKFVKR